MAQLKASAIYVRVPINLHQRMKKAATENRRTLAMEAVVAFENHLTSLTVERQSKG